MAAPVSPAQVLDALRPIIDPDFGKSIVDLGFIKELKVDGPTVSFSIELTTPACPVKDEFKAAAKQRVEALDGVEEAAVTMTANTRQAGRTGGGDGDQQVNLPGVKNIIAVASGLLTALAAQFRLLRPVVSSVPFPVMLGFLTSIGVGLLFKAVAITGPKAVLPCGSW